MNILLVEDNLSVRESLYDFLTTLGHHVIESDQGQHAFDKLLKRKVHLVLSDIQMPVMDGFQLLKKIKQSETLKDIEVILFTGYGDVKSAVDAIRNGAYDYLLKPVNINELDILLKRFEEYLSLKNENKKLTREFEEEVHKATQDIEKELIEIRRAFAKEIGSVEIGLFSNSMRSIFETTKKLHENPEIPVLIEGETGTGKELIAHVIHYGKGDVITPFVGLNCAAISSTLFESELFGYEAGAFTGGNPKGQKGKLELAENGTLFLDEITEMDIKHQAKLLRLIEEREFYRVGGIKRRKTTARFICATNQNVNQLIDAGSFRQDLFYRLNVGYIRIPPLRERIEEIVPLTQLFLKQLCNKKKTRFCRIGKKAEKFLTSYPWPGNIRELKNTIERIVLYLDDEEIQPKHLESCLSFHNSTSSEKFQPILDPNNLNLPDHSIDLNGLTLTLVRKALEKNKGHQTKTAKYLGISLRVLHTYLKKLEGNGMLL